MKINRIRLKKLNNTRDIGGYTGIEGRKIKSHMLIRSGALSSASEDDLRILTEEYGLRYVIDLRTEAEIHEKPEILPDCVECRYLPLLDNSFLGIARDEYSIKSWFNLFENSKDEPSEIFYKMYDMLVFGERSKKLICEFFSILQQSDGTVLWHCSAGKDRVGITTILLLVMLGVDRETIIKDYLATRYFTAPSIIKTRLLCAFILRKRRLRKCLAVLLDVKRVYAERILDKIYNEFGSVEEFFLSQYGITEEEINFLRNKYLE